MCSPVVDGRIAGRGNALTQRQADSLNALCGWAEILAEKAGWTRENAMSFWASYDAAREAARAPTPPEADPCPCTTYCAHAGYPDAPLQRGLFCRKQAFARPSADPEAQARTPAAEGCTSSTVPTERALSATRTKPS